MLKSGGFWHRFLTAVVSATLVFTPFYIWLFVGTVIGRVEYESPWVTFLNSLDVFAIGQLVIALGVLVIAYPVEKYFNNENKSTLKNASTYVLIALIAGSIFFVLMLNHISGGEYWHVIGLNISFFGLITAFFGRLIYPTLLKRKYFVKVSATTITVLALGALLISPIAVGSPAADGFYPATFDREVARASWDVKESDGSGSSNYTEGSGTYNPNLGYTLTFRCGKANGAKFKAIIQSKENQETLNETEINCDTTEQGSWPIDLGIKELKVRMILFPMGDAYNINGVNTHPDTWAVLAPTFAN